MSTHTNEGEKSGRKNKSKDDNEPAEVLVLPPEILQKLGICLGNINLVHEGDKAVIKNLGSDNFEENSFGVISVSKENNIIYKNDLPPHTSMMETASLMKESVFLSPTFTSSSPNISSIISHETALISIQGTNSKSEDHTGDDISEKGIKPLSNVLISSIANRSLDEKTTQKTGISAINKDKSKICVLSDKIIEPKMLKELRIFNSNSDSTLIPAETVITKNKNQHLRDTVSESKHKALMSSNNHTKDGKTTCFNGNALPYSIDEHKDANNDFVNGIHTLNKEVSNVEDLATVTSCITRHSESNSRNVYLKAKLSPKISGNSIEPELYHSRKPINTKQKSSEITKVNVVNDIQQGERDVEMESDIAADINVQIDYKEDIVVKEISANKSRCILQSKTHIQGVEKPGGDYKRSNDRNFKQNNIKLRTYGRYRSEKPLKILRQSQSYDHLTTTTCDLGNGSQLETYRTQAFCICNDFGRYSYYDLREDLYVHLHFMKQSHVGIPNELLFSICNEEMTVTVANQVQIEEDDQEDGNEMICSNFLSEADEFFDEDTFTNEKIKEDEDASKSVDSVVKMRHSDSKDGSQAAPTEVETTRSNEKGSTSMAITPLSTDLNDNNEKEIQVVIVVDDTPNIVQEMNDNGQNKRMGKKRKRQDSEKSPLVNLKKKTRNSLNVFQEKFVEFDAGKRILKKHDAPCRNKTAEVDTNSEIQKDKGKVSCGVCHQAIDNKMWFAHIGKEHSYLAWKSEETAKDFTSESVVHEHLRKILERLEHLECGRCGVRRTNTKSYLDHVNKCNFVSVVSIAREQNEKSVVKCGVCEEDVSDWLDHICKEHNYLAWKYGEKPLNFNDENIVRQYLYSITKQIDGLVCGKCGCRRKYVKAYLDHVKSCDKADLILNSSVENSQNRANTVKCGVCHKDVKNQMWDAHKEQEHNYLAWEEGQPPLDLDDKEAIHDYLYNISKENKGLICSKCGCRRKYVKSYLDHIKTCTGSDDTVNDSLLESSNDASMSNVTEEKDEHLVKCGVCHKEIQNGGWIQHIREEHDYIAWKHNERPLDVNNKTAVSDHLYDILKKYNGLFCKKCGCRRKYVKLYLDHIKVCDGTKDSPANNSLLNSSRDKSDKRNSEIPDVSGRAKVTCGVCQKEMEDQDWLSHIEMDHGYVAWKDSEKALDINDKEAIHDYLYKISKQNDGLVCSKCGCRRKYVKSFLGHTKRCTGNSDDVNDSIVNNSQLNDSIMSIDDTNDVRDSVYKCGVCQKHVDSDKWFQHIGEEHNYIAWKENGTPIDPKDSEALYQHFYDLIQEYGQLTCKFCGVQRKYAKLFMGHLQSCSDNPSGNRNSLLDDNTLVKCGVCQKEIQNKKWCMHIQRMHNYIAWKEGDEPFDTEDPQKVSEHLSNLSRLYDGLTCAKCNVTKRYAKSFLNHVNTCDSDVDVTTLPEYELSKDEYVCAICHEKGPIGDWKVHAMDTHYNVAWCVGDRPIDLKNTNAVEPWLKEYKRVKKSLECVKCGVVRASIAGFYAHVAVCGKTEEETELYKSVCKICGVKYLGVYKTQHMQSHREQNPRNLTKLEINMKDADDEGGDDGDENGDNGDGTPKQRRAAKKAKNVIKRFSAKIELKEESDVESDDQNYDETKDAISSDTDTTVKSDISSEEVSTNEADSDLSDEEKVQVKRKKKYTESSYAMTNHRRIPTVIKNPAAYIANASKDFRDTHLTTSTLFPQWLTCEYVAVPEEELPKYMPTLLESCKVKYTSEGWTTLKRFEARNGKEVSLFAGGSVSGARWARAARAVLAVRAHAAADAPRLDAAAAAAPAHPALLQLWDFGDMTQLPTFALGLAHDYGTVWGMEWCPSGAYEPPPGDDTHGFVRLGLLAIACSNGSAYIFSIPYPSTIVQNDKLVYKLKPVAELRLFRDEKRKFQCTAIDWSIQKRHSCVIAGYANGSIAYFDLNTDSPLLTCVEDGVNIYYPYHDERPHPACITDVTSLCGGGRAGAAGGVVSAAATGAAAALGGARLHLQLTPAAAARAPLWPAAVLAGNSDIVAQAVNEVEWWGSGRRLGPLGAAGGCELCAALAVSLPPLIKTMYLHPAYADKRDIQIRAKICMVPLDDGEASKAINKIPEWEMETYEEVVKSYGIEFKRASQLKKNELQQYQNRPRKRCPERFPLADVTSVDFCPVLKYHKRLAIATHSGMIFVINT